MKVNWQEVGTIELNNRILNAIKQNHGIITTKDIIDLGFSRTTIIKYAQNGELERIGHGVYALPDTVIDDMYLLMLRSNKIIFSHDTALFLNGLSNRTPFIHSITIPSNATVPKSLRDECICYYIRPELFGLGQIERDTTFGYRVRCYNPERTLCDLLRSRSRCDEEMVISAVKNYASYNDKDLHRMADYAEKLKVTKDLSKYMEVLL